jgi:hypothetical protein
MSSFDSIVTRARESTSHGSRAAGRSRFPSRAPCSTGSAIGRYWRGVEAKRSAFAPGDSRPVSADTHHAIAGREDRIPEGGVPQRSGDRRRRPVLPVGRRGQVRCRAAEGDGVRGRADVAGAPGLASLVLTHPGSTATEVTSGSLRFQARARATSHALLSAYARRGSVSRPRAAGRGRAAPARPEPSQSNHPCSSADSRWVRRCGARTSTAKVVS